MESESLAKDNNIYCYIPKKVEKSLKLAPRSRDVQCIYCEVMFIRWLVHIEAYVV